MSAKTSSFDLKKLSRAQEKRHEEQKTQLGEFKNYFVENPPTVQTESISIQKWNNGKNPHQTMLDATRAFKEELEKDKEYLFIYYFKYKEVLPEKIKAVIDAIKFTTKHNKKKGSNDKEIKKNKALFENEEKSLLNRYKDYKEQVQKAIKLTENDIYGLPENRPDTDNDTILYVGSTIRPLTGRLRAHFGKEKSKNTFGLHLCLWNHLVGLEEVTLTTIGFEKTYFILQGEKGNGKKQTEYNPIKIKIFQELEDRLHENLDPLLGKKGSK